MSRNYEKVSHLERCSGIKEGDERAPDWEGAKEQNLKLFERFEAVIDAVDRRDLGSVRQAMGRFVFSAYGQAYRLGVDLDQALDQVYQEELSRLDTRAWRFEPPKRSDVVTVNTILLVEDDPDEERLARYALKNSGFEGEVVVAKDGEEALDYLLAKGPHCNRDANQVPRVVFLDINLPKLDGFDVLKAIRNDSRTSLVPVVLLTNSEEERDKREGFENGANSYVLKPHDLESFVSSVNELSSYWTSLNCPAYQQ